MNKIIITEEEKNNILSQHSKKGYKLSEQEEPKKFETGKRGMKAATSWSEFEATPMEMKIMGKLFGKYGSDIPPIVIRYLRKIPRKVLTQRLLDLNLIKKEDLQ